LIVPDPNPIPNHKPNPKSYPNLKLFNDTHGTTSVSVKGLRVFYPQNLLNLGQDAQKMKGRTQFPL